jgi:hypothetical protein
VERGREGEILNDLRQKFDNLTNSIAEHIREGSYALLVVKS